MLVTVYSASAIHIAHAYSPTRAPCHFYHIRTFYLDYVASPIGVAVNRCAKCVYHTVRDDIDKANGRWFLAAIPAAFAAGQTQCDYGLTVMLKL